MTRTFLFLLVMAAFASSSMLAGCSSSTSPGSGGGSGGGLFVPDTVNFGSLASGQTKDTVISIFNETGAAISITGNSLSSAQATDTNFSHPVSVAPGYITIHVEFTSSGSGANSAMDSIRYESGGRSYVAIMRLEANSSVTTGGSGNLFVPAEIDFGTLAIGQWHDTTTVIANTGSAPITIISSFVSGSEARDTNFSQPVTLNGGGYITIHLQFNPAQAGFRTAVDSIRYVAGGTLHSTGITMTATGVTGSNTPGPGSTFTFSVDTNGVHLPRPSTYTVVSNSLFYQGKTNVVEVRDDTGGISYYHLEPNGDLSVFIDFSAQSALPIPLPATWLVIPLGSKQTITSVLYDTTIQYQGFPLTIQIVDTGQYTGPSQITAAGKSFATEQGSLTVALTASAFGFPVASSETTVNIWYANTLAFYPKRRDVSATGGSAVAGQSSGALTTNYLLTTYSVK
ncbi:MAG TPA: choice-of-anchor D domain-containing protein [Candidatus Kapabacteria bacterium]|nr:choice-of-anchor D domain-containing protein [Candidatus Kapabacteria bacterium]